jgi:hypothetical protein
MKSYAVVFLSLFLLHGTARPAHALDVDSELVRSLARHVSRTLAPEAAAPAVLAARQVAPLAATMPGANAITPAAIIDARIMTAEPQPSPASKVFPVLAASYVALNALDIYTTTRALGSGRGAEGNPVLGPVAPSPAALTAVKIATTATTLVMAKRLWKDHRIASITLMVAANVGTSFVVAHNAMIAR